MKKVLLTTLISVTSFNVMAFSVPSAPSSPSGYDEVRTSEGTTCRSSVGGNLQVYGGLVDVKGADNYYGDSDEQGAFVGFAYSFGSKERISCNRIMEIETQRAELELQKLKSEIRALEKIRELNMLEAGGNLPKLTRNSK